MKLLIDMNLSPRWVEFFANAGLDAVHWSKVGSGKAPDAEIMTYAKAHDYVVLTHDLDFGAILAATQGEKPSVVQVRAEDLRPEAIGATIVAGIRQMEDELRDGALLTIEPEKTRVRILPLRR